MELREALEQLRTQDARDSASVRIGDLCDLQNGRAFKQTEWEPAGLPIIRIQNLNDPFKPYNYYSGVLPERFRVRPGDVLLSWSGTPGTSFGCFIWSGPEGWLNQHIFNVRLDQGRILPKFFAFHVNAILSELISKAHGGVGLRHITKRELDNIVLRVPTLSEQEHVVDLLSRAESIVEMQRQSLANADGAFQAMLSGAFARPIGMRSKPSIATPMAN
jgi:type I restriction enzyme S subunit